jgi:RNA polymerase sigma factor (sigma-70 family)
MRESKVGSARLDWQEPRYDPYINIDLWQAIRTLPARDQVLVRLFFLEGHTYKEIARMVQLPENTIGSCIFRAKVQLREILLPVGKEGIG